MAKPFQLFGPWQFKSRVMLTLLSASLTTSFRRAIKGPYRPGWNPTLEMSTTLLRQIDRAAARLPKIEQQRQYVDTLLFSSTAVPKVTITPVKEGEVTGHWYCPKEKLSRTTLLYLHGGGYAFYSRSHENLIALVALAAQAKTFALDYPLTPENPYPAQLNSALDAYRWLLASGIAPDKLVVIGDSAGGNLTLALLLALREQGLPMPALAACLCPWVDLSCSSKSMDTNHNVDWIDKAQVLEWADWFRGKADLKDPRLSPLYADLRGLAPLYIQAGTGEVLIDQIREFVSAAHRQNIVIDYREWDNMPHDFQAYGPLLPQAAEALNHLSTIINRYTTG